MVRKVPGAYPVAGFPGSAASKSTATRQVGLESSFILGGTTREARGAAGEVVGPTVGDGAVPVPRPHVRPRDELGPGLSAPASLARLSPLEIVVLAVPTTPIARPVHPFSDPTIIYT